MQNPRSLQIKWRESAKTKAAKFRRRLTVPSILSHGDGDNLAAMKGLEDQKYTILAVKSITGIEKAWYMTLPTAENSKTENCKPKR